MASDDERSTRGAIVAACRRMQALGINQGTSGNVSVRVPGGLLITPSGLDYDEMEPDDIVRMTMAGDVHARDGLRPSSEWRFHLDVMRAKAAVGAVVHAHPIFATALAIHGRAIPAVHYMVAAAGGGDIPCAPYATFGTEALSRHVVAALAERHACLLAHHGMIATGSDLARALWLAVEVETLARQYHAALLIGPPPVLDPAEIARVSALFAGYGRRERPED